MELYISPCPNDTFAFYAMIHGAVDCEGLTFTTHFEDIDCLNQRAAAKSGADIIKISCAQLTATQNDYTLLPAGAALGYGNGPLLVSKHKIYPDELPHVTVGIPGLNTTANLLLDRTLPLVKSKKVYLFSDIATAVMDGEIDAGVLIHEGRFTYRKMGLQLIADLGAEWEKLTHKPIPLGCIVAQRFLPTDQISRVIRRSVEFAMAHPDIPMEFVRNHARELEPQVLQSHISYFVNAFTVDLGDVGVDAISQLLGVEIQPLQ